MPIQDRFGAFLPTTEIFEIEDIENISINSPEYKDFLVRLRYAINNIATVLNRKETGIYSKTEFVTGGTWYPDPALTSYTAKKPVERQIFRQVIDTGALLNTAAKNVAHNIIFPNPNTYSAVKIYGAATDPAGVINIPLPYSSPVLTENISVFIDTNNVTITTGNDRTAFTKSYIVFEFIKE